MSTSPYRPLFPDRPRPPYTILHVQTVELLLTLARPSPGPISAQSFKRLIPSSPRGLLASQAPSSTKPQPLAYR